MPQIDQLDATLTSQIFWLLVFFGLAFFVIGKGMVPKVMDTVSLRDKQISDDLAAARTARDEADAQEENWRRKENANRADAQALVAEAKGSARADTERRLAEVQQRLDAQLEEADARIASAREAAADEIEAVAAEAAQDIAARVAGIQVDAAAASSAVKKVMAHG